jgi:hypothetical protein
MQDQVGLVTCLISDIAKKDTISAGTKALATIFQVTAHPSALCRMRQRNVHSQNLILG